MGMQREADLIEQQIKMRGSAPGPSGGKWFVAALSELVPRFFSFAPSSSLKFYYILKLYLLIITWLLCCCRNIRPMRLLLLPLKKQPQQFSFLFFSPFYILYKTTYLPFINNYKKNHTLISLPPNQILFWKYLFDCVL